MTHRRRIFAIDVFVMLVAVLALVTVSCGGGGGDNAANPLEVSDDGDTADTTSPPADVASDDETDPGETLEDIDPESGIEPETQWQAVMAGISDEGEVPLDTALQAFSILVSRLPGVELPNLPAADDIDHSGTMAVAWIQHHWGSLTDEQQAAVVEALGGPASDPKTTQTTTQTTGSALRDGPPPSNVATGAVDGDLAAGETPDTSAPEGEEPQGPDPDCFTLPAVKQNGPGTERFVAALEAVRPDLNERLGGLGRPAYVQLLGKDEGAAHALTISQVSGCVGPSAVCTIYITPRGEEESGKRLEMIMAHEMVHCYQGAVGVDIQGGGAPWMIEGFAAWAGQEVVGGVEFEKTDMWWRDYLTMPGKPLFSRSYDAIGF